MAGLLRLTPEQDGIFGVLLDNIGRCVDVSELFRKVWGGELPNPKVCNPVRRTIYELRRCLREQGSPNRIKTIRSRGYQLILGHALPQPIEVKKRAIAA